MRRHVEVNDSPPDPLGVRDRVGGTSPAPRRRAVPDGHEDVARPHDPRHGRLVRVDGGHGEGKTRLPPGSLDQSAVPAPARAGDEVVGVAVEGTDDLQRNPEPKCGLGKERVRTFGEGRDAYDMPMRRALGAKERGALGGDE